MEIFTFYNNYWKKKKRKSDGTNKFENIVTLYMLIFYFFVSSTIHWLNIGLQYYSS